MIIVYSNIDTQIIESRIEDFISTEEVGETFYRLTEDGDTRILEDSDIRILE
jgi:hypothetical protein